MTISNSDAVNALIHLLRTYEHDSIWYLATDSLKRIAIGYLDAINALIELLPTIKNQTVFWQTFMVLSKIGVGNHDLILTLNNLLQTCQDDETRQCISELLEMFNPNK